MSSYSIQQEPFDTDINRRSIKSDVGWPEYLKGNGKKEGTLGILISNSQGNSYEIDDQNLIYFNYLKDSLSKIIPDLELANWSVGGIRTVDAELLTLQAYKRKADFIIYVLGPGNFDDSSYVRLDYSSTDINLMAGDPFFWPLEKYTLYGTQVKMNDRLKRLVTLKSAIARFRSTLYDITKKEIPLEQHLFAYGDFYRMEFDIDDVDLTKIWKAMDEVDMGDKPSKKVLKTIMKKVFTGRDRTKKVIVQSGATLAKFNENIHGLFEDTDTKIIYVHSPAPYFMREKNKFRGINFREVFDTMPLDSSKFSRYNLWNVLDEQHFQKNSTHFNEEGNILFANLLFSLIKDEF